MHLMYIRIFQSRRCLGINESSGIEPCITVFFEVAATAASSHLPESEGHSDAAFLHRGSVLSLNYITVTGTDAVCPRISCLPCHDQQRSSWQEHIDIPIFLLEVHYTRRTQ